MYYMKTYIVKLNNTYRFLYIIYIYMIVRFGKDATLSNLLWKLVQNPNDPNYDFK
jgi:hypothetical protein